MGSQAHQLIRRAGRRTRGAPQQPRRRRKVALGTGSQRGELWRALGLAVPAALLVLGREAARRRDGEKRAASAWRARIPPPYLLRRFTSHVATSARHTQTLSATHIYASSPRPCVSWLAQRPLIWICFVILPRTLDCESLFARADAGILHIGTRFRRHVVCLFTLAFCVWRVQERAVLLLLGAAESAALRACCGTWSCPDATRGRTSSTCLVCAGLQDAVERTTSALLMGAAYMTTLRVCS